MASKALVNNRMVSADVDRAPSMSSRNTVASSVGAAGATACCGACRASTSWASVLASDCAVACSARCAGTQPIDVSRQSSLGTTLALQLGGQAEQLGPGASC